jgi:UDP-N-acetylmuramoyl-tripeptide--D-alanyl-D-alanine ligase
VAVVADVLGLSGELIASGLASAGLPAQRFSRSKVGNWLVVDDSYNANPTSMEAALDVLAELNFCRDRLAILGEMLELGDKSQESHERLGRLAAKSGLLGLAVVGPAAGATARGAIEAGLASDRVACFDSAITAARWIAAQAPKKSVILVKGSHGVGMEKAVQELREIKAEGGSGSHAL